MLNRVEKDNFDFSISPEIIPFVNIEIQYEKSRADNQGDDLSDDNFPEATAIISIKSMEAVAQTMHHH